MKPNQKSSKISKLESPAEVFSNPELASVLTEELLALEADLAALSARAAELRSVLDTVAEVSEVYAGVALRIVNAELDQGSDISVHPVAARWPNRWAQVCRNVRTGEWMVYLHGPGLRSGGEILATTFTTTAPAVSLAKRWTALGLRQ